MKNYIFLLLAILFETIATSMLKTSEQFTKPVPSIVTILCYAGAFYFLSLTLKTIPVGIAYAIWSAVGIVLITLVGIFVFKQVPDLPAIIGLLLIIAGVIIINVFSKTSAH
ncbi:DMT family transporter [Niabella beijingensis]|uniref:DMT family transporter n=1 Tax=Niabella beijingensis TaxID=2872700 RepID=UPI001CBF3C53|nr:SMR family transporter [Niabella beijingensis]MBZ4187902.1 QacE family quaternary ammonium compound efflux SMR transporter [Niabella beijingensis]